MGVLKHAMTQLRDERIIVIRHGQGSYVRSGRDAGQESGTPMTNAELQAQLSHMKGDPAEEPAVTLRDRSKHGEVAQCWAPPITPPGPRGMPPPRGRQARLWVRCTHRPTPDHAHARTRADGMTKRHPAPVGRSATAASSHCQRRDPRPGASGEGWPSDATGRCRRTCPAQTATHDAAKSRLCGVDGRGCPAPLPGRAS